MRVLFRADASVEIGTGHVVRCATLAEALRAQGAEVAFACRALPGHLLAWLQQKGFTTFALSEDATDSEPIEQELSAALYTWVGEAPIDWLVVDHYGLDARWESAMRGQCRQILVIDDLANRAHDCDLLLDQNLLDPKSTRYLQWIPPHCQQLLGPSFALLRPEFRQAREGLMTSHVREKDSPQQPQPPAPLIDSLNETKNPPQIPRILIFFGGSDPTQECFKALEALRLLPSHCDVAVDLVAGASNPRFEDLQALCQEFPQVRLHRQVNAMSELMSRADLTIGAGGTTTWERFCLGLPSIIIAVADNQVEISQNLAENGYHLYLGESRSVSAASLSEALLHLIQNPRQQQALSQQGMALVDGLGVQRVVQLMHSICENKLSL